MNNYLHTIYSRYKKSNYPDLFANYLYKKFISPKRKINLLDLGCGKGEYIESFKKVMTASTIEGVDKGFEPRYYRGEGDFERDELPYDDNVFDFIFCKSVIEHVRNTDNLLSEAYRILKPKGKLIILTPSWKHNYKDFYNDYTHVHPFDRKGLQDALRVNNFQNVTIEYFYHLPWLWNQPYLLPVAKFLSLFSRWKWKDKEETQHRVNIRFGQEVQLLGIGEK